MSAYTMDQVWAPIEAHNRAIALYNTFGHLYPEFGKTYSGHIDFAVGGFEDLAVLNASFEELPDSPELYDDLQEFTDRFMNLPESKKLLCGVWSWTGTYTKRKNGTGYFTKGKLVRIHAFS